LKPGILERKSVSFTARECCGSYDANARTPAHLDTGTDVQQPTPHASVEDRRVDGIKRITEKGRTHAFLALIFMLYTSKTPGSPHETNTIKKSTS
jgi:hypothetical protein